MIAIDYYGEKSRNKLTFTPPPTREKYLVLSRIGGALTGKGHVHSWWIAERSIDILVNCANKQ